MSIDAQRFLAAMTEVENVEASGPSRDSKKRPRGLAERKSLESLARTYLEEQATHWPALAKQGVVPAPTKKVISKMADQFEEVYCSGTLPTYVAPDSIQNPIGAVYTRYSDANSNPRSLNQQLINTLRKAAFEGVFVPWNFVFADAGTTGTNEHRRGYQLLKQLIAQQPEGLTVVLIDELGRASRDQLESLALGRLIDGRGMRLIGATDGFDSINPMSKVWLTIFGLIHELFVDQLREKVDRGMNDAFKQGRPVYKPGFGYALEPIVDDSGNPVVSSDGKSVQQVVIVEEEAEQVRRIFKLYADEKLSPQQITQLLNKEKVGDRAWTNSQVRKLLSRSMYEGREPWGKTTREVNPHDGTVRTINLPEREWKWRDVPHLRIVDDALWQAVQERASQRSRAYNPRDKSKQRGEVNSARIFNLVCGHCGGQMWCDRGGERPIVRCNRGRDGCNGCTARASKTLAHIEESLLNHILGMYWSEEFAEELLQAANAALSEYAKQPAVDVAPLRKELSDKRRRLKRIADKLAESDEGNFDTIFAVARRLELEISELSDEISKSESADVPVSPIRRTDLAGLLESLRELLYENVAEAKSVLSALTGQVRLMQTEVEGKKRPEWTAEVTWDHTKVLVEIARQKNCPSTDMWEFLCNRSWTFGETTSVTIRNFKNAERIAKTAGEMSQAGSAHHTIAVALSVDVETVKQAIKHYEAGNVCHLPPKDLSVRRQQPGAKVEKIGPEVVRLVDEQNKTLGQVAEQLGTSHSLVSRAYRQQKREETIEHAKNGKTVKPKPRLRLSPEKHERIRELLTKTDMSLRAIAREVGCNHHSVRDAKRRMLEEEAS